MYKYRVPALGLILLAIMAFASCTNDPDEIGIGVQPDNERLNMFATDTVTVAVHSNFVDSVKTDETSRSLLGSYVDPVFGRTTASIYTQLRLSTTSVDFGDNPQLDSIVLSLEYTSIPLADGSKMTAYGDTSTPQTFRVYEIDEPLNLDSSYYSNRAMALKQPEIGIKTIAIHPTDSLYIGVDSVRVMAQLRIPLTEAFGYHILTAPQENLGSMDKFLDFIKGIYVTADPVSSGGAIGFFDLLKTNSKVTVFYSNNEDDSLAYNFQITSESARYIHYSHDYSMGSSDFLAQLQGDTALGAQKIYLQSMSGVSAEISFPYFRNWAGKHIALNEAKLVLTNIDQNSGFQAPPDLVLYRLTEDGAIKFLADQPEGPDYFGGKYDAESGTYTFRITQHLQQVLTTDTLTNRLYLGISGASLMPNRLIMAGYNPEPPVNFADRLRLSVIYTKLAN